jgi:hypothetical protein
MPEISRFLGIVIKMNIADSDLPHFHASYNEFEAIIDIENFGIVDGELSPRVYGFVVQWAEIHKKELVENWKLGLEGKPLNKIEPLE